MTLVLVADGSAADRKDVNYDESKVGSFTLPDSLTCIDGTKVTDAKTWTSKRRPELLELFRSQMHGRSPARPKDMKFEVTSTDKTALSGLATRKEITVHFDAKDECPPMRILLYTPNAAKQPVPCFIGVNFEGNHTAHTDPAITITDEWTWDAKTKQEKLVHPTDTTRGKSANRWPMEKIIQRGYAVATIPRADIEPDYAEGWHHGVRGYFLKQSGKTEFAADDWGAIAAWAWGLSRTVDYLETDRAVDAQRVIVTGHSRMGKASLWAGATDERFAIVVSNDSGEGGAALARRNIGETTAIINTSFPHWFCGNFKPYGGHAEQLPFDQHELIALVAPRPVYIASATEDKWADPRGEFLSGKNAEPVYALFHKAGLGVTEQPAPEHPVGDFIGYHLRTGKHDIAEYDS